MMLNKINIGRAYIFSPSIHIVFRVEISGHPQVSSLEKAIRYATSKYEILNCRILQYRRRLFLCTEKDYRFSKYRDKKLPSRCSGVYK